MQSSQAFYHFICLRSKYSFQHPVLKYPQAVFLLFQGHKDAKFGTNHVIQTLCYFVKDVKFNSYSTNTHCLPIFIKKLFITTFL
jgi:hypothetical protein